MADWYDDSKKYRVLRGGSWVNDSSNLRTSLRGRNQPDNWYDGIGFRCAREALAEEPPPFADARDRV